MPCVKFRTTNMSRKDASRYLVKILDMQYREFGGLVVNCQN